MGLDCDAGVFDVLAFAADKVVAELEDASVGAPSAALVVVVVVVVVAAVELFFFRLFFALFERSKRSALSPSPSFRSASSPPSSSSELQSTDSDSVLSSV